MKRIEKTLQVKGRWGMRSSSLILQGFTLHSERRRKLTDNGKAISFHLCLVASSFRHLAFCHGKGGVPFYR